MKKNNMHYAFFLSLILLCLTGCVSKKKYDTMRLSYEDSLSRVKKNLQTSQEQRQVLAKGISILKKQVQDYQNTLASYQDSLKYIQRSISAIQGDSSAQQYLSTENQRLKINLSKLEEEKQALSIQLAQLEALNQHYLDKVQYLQDSLAVIQGFIQNSYATTFNFTRQIKRYDNTFDCYIVNIQKSKLRFFWRNKNGQEYRSFKNLLYQLHRQNETLLFATNAGMYTPQNAPQGLYVENSKQMIPLDLSPQGDGNFYMKPNGVFMIDTEGNAHIQTSEEFVKCKDSILHATQSGPMLLNQGKIHPTFTQGSSNKYIRNGVGIISPHQVVFIISQKPVNFYDFASLFKDYFKCKEALYLDGAISQMFLPEIGRFDLEGDFGPMIGILK